MITPRGRHQFPVHSPDEERDLLKVTKAVSARAGIQISLADSQPRSVTPSDDTGPEPVALW